MITSSMPFLFFYGLIGLLIGSFLNVVIIRVPKEENIAFPSSHCIKCNHPLKWYHNIPVFSWIFLKGKCAFCGEKISIQYPIVEILTSVLFTIVAYRVENIKDMLVLSILFSMLLSLSFIDLKYKAVPDNISIPALIISLFFGNFLVSLQNALILAGAFCLLRIFVSWIIKKEAMGEADIIIAGIIGAILGVEYGFVAIYISALIALPVFLIVSKKGYELPFIPFLALGLFITWEYLDNIKILMDMLYE
ncbi:prepilin peptidase [Sulfurospirillum sp. 1307]|jgi:leader peptidase (prepilin peptidase)/N-methyltransferase